MGVIAADQRGANLNARESCGASLLHHTNECLPGYPFQQRSHFSCHFEAFRFGAYYSKAYYFKVGAI